MDPELERRIDPHHESMVQHHGPVHSVLDTGAHPEVTYENTDARAGIVIGSLAIIALTLAVTAIVTLPIENLLKTANPPGKLPSPLAPARIVPAQPRIEVHPWSTYPDLKAHWQAELSKGGVGDNGERRQPISTVLDQTASSLPIRPGSGPGLTMPGGEGRTFSHALNQLPAAYREIAQPPTAAGAATIQGEIRKNAKK